MPKKGYTSVTISERIKEELNKIADSELCENTSEVIRLLVRNYRKEQNVRSGFISYHKASDRISKNQGTHNFDLLKGTPFARAINSTQL